VLALEAAGDELAPRSVRARAFYLAGVHSRHLGELELAVEYLERGYADNPYREIVSTELALALYDAWRQAPAPRPAAVLARSVSMARRAVAEATFHFEHRNEGRPAEGGEVPQRVLADDDEVVFATIRSAIEPLVAARELDAAAALLRHPRARDGGEARHDALLGLLVAFAKGERPSLDGVLPADASPGQVGAVEGVVSVLATLDYAEAAAALRVALAERPKGR